MNTLNSLNSEEGLIYGPFLPLSGMDVAHREEHEYRRRLTDTERITLQAMHQISERAWSYTEENRTDEAQPIHAEAQNIHISLLNAGRL